MASGPFLVIVGGRSNPSIPTTDPAPPSPPAPQPPSPPKTDRVFIALYPDAETRARIEALAQQLRSTHSLQGKPLALERVHVTLLFLGDFATLSAEWVENARTVCAKIAATTTPFEVALDRVKSFPGRGRKPLVLGESGYQAALHTLHQRLHAAFDGVGASRKFVPHLTLLYDEQGVPPQRIAEPVRWQAKEFVLVHSLIGKSLHVPLGKWTLRG